MVPRRHNFYTNGISCLAKLKNGVDPMFEDIGEAKTEDFNIVPNAPVCDDLICVFPEGWRSDEFVTFRFFPFNDKDSSLYLVDPATGIEAFKMFEYDGPAKLQIVARATDGQFYPAAENLESTLIDMDPMENSLRPLIRSISEFFRRILPEENPCAASLSIPSSKDTITHLLRVGVENRIPLCTAGNGQGVPLQ